MVVASTQNVSKARARGWGYDGRLGDLLLRLAAAPDRTAAIDSADLEPQRVNTAANPEDFGNEFGARYSLADFTGGEGLEYAHRRNASPNDSSRYYDSRNIDFLSDGRVTLLETTEQVEATANTNLYADYDGTTLRWTDGTTLRATTDPSVATPTIGNEDCHAGEGATTVTGIAHLGTDLYAGVGDGLHQFTVAGGAWTHLVTESGGVDRVWTAKGRVIYAVGNVLKELTDPSVPTTTTLVTLPTGAEWCDVADAGSHVLASASDGHIYAFTFDGSAFALTGQSYLEGEEPCGLGESFGLVFFGTTVDSAAGGKIGRLYRASLDDNGVLSGIEQIKRFGDLDDETLDRSVKWVSAGRDSVFVGVREGADEVNLWRYDLGFDAIHRSYVIDNGGLATDFLLLAGDPWTWVAGKGPHRITDLKADEGYIVSPLADHFTSQAKSWASIDVAHTATTGAGDSVSVEYGTTRELLDLPTGDWSPVASISTGIFSGELPLSRVTSRFLSVKLILASTSDNTAAPTVESFTVRSYPGSGDTIITLPVNVSDAIERPGRRRTNVRNMGRSLYRQLSGIEGVSTDLELYGLNQRWRGVVQKVQTPVVEFSYRGSETLVAYVTFRGRLVADLTDQDVFALNMFAEGDFG